MNGRILMLAVMCLGTLSADALARIEFYREAAGEPLVGAQIVFGGGAAAGQRVVLEADEFPYDDAFHAVDEAVSEDGYGFRLSATLTRNAHYRAVTPDTLDVSDVISAVAELGHSLRFGQAEVRKRVTLVMRGPREALNGRRAFVYRARNTKLRRVGAITLHSTSRQRAWGSTRLSRRIVTDVDGAFVCLHEARDDGFGQHSRLQEQCGRPRLRHVSGATGLGILLTELY